jgi:hypothetical protein
MSDATPVPDIPMFEERARNFWRDVFVEPMPEAASGLQESNTALLFDARAMTLAPRRDANSADSNCTNLPSLANTFPEQIIASKRTSSNKHRKKSIPIRVYSPHALASPPAKLSEAALNRPNPPLKLLY